MARRGRVDRLREEALREMVARVGIDGPDVVAVHPQPNGNAWLLGYAAVNGHMGMVVARGVGPAEPSSSTGTRGSGEVS